MRNHNQLFFSFVFLFVCMVFHFLLLLVVLHNYANAHNNYHLVVYLPESHKLMILASKRAEQEKK